MKYHNSETVLRYTTEKSIVLRVLWFMIFFCCTRRSTLPHIIAHILAQLEFVAMDPCVFAGRPYESSIKALDPNYLASVSQLRSAVIHQIWCTSNRQYSVGYIIIFVPSSHFPKYEHLCGLKHFFSKRIALSFLQEIKEKKRFQWSENLNGTKNKNEDCAFSETFKRNISHCSKEMTIRMLLPRIFIKTLRFFRPNYLRF